MAEVHHLANSDDVSQAVVVSVVDRNGQVMWDVACLMPAFSGLDIGVREDHGLQLRLDHIGQESGAYIPKHALQGREGGPQPN